MSSEMMDVLVLTVKISFTWAAGTSLDLDGLWYKMWYKMTWIYENQIEYSRVIHVLWSDPLNYVTDSNFILYTLFKFLSFWS